MKRFCACLIFVSSIVFGKSLTLNEWIDYFHENKVYILYSSDFISQDILQSIINLNEETPSELSRKLNSYSLTLAEVDAYNYVITGYDNKTPPETGLVIKLFDQSQQKTIRNFTVISPQKVATTHDGTVILNNIAPGKLNLSIRTKGYYPLNQIVNSESGQFISYNFNATALPVTIDKLLVTASQINISNLNPGFTMINREEIRQNPSVTSDPLSASRQIAGNTSFGISSVNYTRGGLSNEALIVLDDHILRTPYHFENFYSLFSSINQSIVEEINFYSGVFPIEYGGRLSSVMNIDTDSVTNTPKHEAGLDLLNSYYTYRYNNSGLSKSLLASVRNGGHFIADNTFEHKYTHPEYSDGYFKASQQFNNYWSSSQHLLVSRDELSISTVSDDNDIENAAASFDNQDFWIKLNYDNLQNSFASLQLFATRTHNKRTGMLDNDNTTASLYEDINTKYYGIDYKHTINFDNQISLSFGSLMASEETDITSSRNILHFGELVRQLNLQNQRDSSLLLQNSGLSIAAFINMRYQWNEKVIFDTGLRVDYREWIKKRLYSPRLNLSYFINDTSTFRFALGRHQQPQYIDELLLEDEFPQYFTPASADLMVLEYNTELNDNLSLRTEAYYKKYSSTQPYYQNLFNSLHIVPELYYDRVRVTPEDSAASGIELTLSGDYNNYNWNLSYTFSDIYDEINDQHIPRSWDQHSTIKFKFHSPINLKYLQDWNLDIFAAYSSGWANTEIIESDNDLQVAPRNSSSFSPGMQLDIKLSKNIKTTRGLLNLSVNAINIFNLTSPCCTDYRLDEGELLSETKTLMPFIPNISLNYRWN